MIWQRCFARRWFEVICWNMKIGLIDVDGHNYPNLVLMKLSAWHKSRGDTVEWWWSDMVHYDVVYMSKVFSSEYSADFRSL